MTFLPIVARELRVASRRASTYWTRWSAAFIAILVSGWILLIMRSSPPATVSSSMFTSISIVAFILSLLAGVRNTADCISEEKRENTLGLLFLTDLKGYDVGLGKLAANSLLSIYGFLAILPVLALPLLVGGISGESFFQVALLLGDTLFFSLSAGLLVSAVSRDARRAASGTVGLILLIVGGLPLAGRLISEHLLHRANGQPDAIFLLPSPGYALVLLVGRFTGLTNPQWHFYTSLLAIFAIACLFLLIAVLILPTCWRDKSVASGTANLTERVNQLAYGRAEARTALRARLLEVNPFLWVTGRDRLKTVFVWGFLGVTGLIWLWGYLKWKNEWADLLIGISTAMLVHAVIKVWLTSEACRHFSEQRRSGALELLLSTPLEAPDIIRGQLLSLRRQFAGPVLAVLAGDVFLLGVGLQGDIGTAEAKEFGLFFLAGMLMLLLDVVAVSWAGMWFGLTAKNLNRATRATVSRILTMPWMLFIVFVMIFFTIRSKRNLGLPEEAALLGLVWWFFIGVSIDCVYIYLAKRNLKHRFRAMAVQHYSTSEQSGNSRPLFGRPQSGKVK